MTSEAQIERKFVKLLKKRYGIAAIKFRDPGRKGAPDRIIMLPEFPIFIEFKRPGEAARVEQIFYHNWLNRLDYEVYTCDSAEQAIKVVEEELVRRGFTLREKENKK